uniref:Dynamin-type G domain-containing protein n=1 Tax=Rhabditophanes sp. KR3021 TaxID=114890 RepID=A0AC35UHX9_9BILA
MAAETLPSQTKLDVRKDVMKKKTSVASGHNGSGHLQKFIHAKSEMSSIYDELEHHITDIIKNYTEINTHRNICVKDELKDATDLINSIRAIKETFQRDKMKVVFFGRTSNGKSTAINAMLHKKILPQGMGHTTCCFLQLEGSETDEQFLCVENDDSKIAFDKLHSLSHALSDQNSGLPAMGTSSRLRVFFPKNSAEMLRNDVVILDSPGVDLSEESDSWIDDHCLDADVFVLVCNSEATVTRAEKDFFSRVSKKLVKPNIFILNNRWDAIDDMAKEQVEAVKQQHMNRCIEFLVRELGVCSEKEAMNRIFFTSAKEMLELRLNATENSTQIYKSSNHEYRANAFRYFEDAFKDCISNSAIQTKFQSHNNKAISLVDLMKYNMENVISIVSKENERIFNSQKHLNDEFKEIMDQLKEFTQDYNTHTRRIREEVHLRVSTDFYEVTQRLEGVLDKFDETLIDTEEGIAVYKNKIADFINKAIATDLRALCGVSLENRIRSMEMDVYDNVKNIYHNRGTSKIDSAWKRVKNPSINITINCNQYMADFREDLEFHFTFGFTNIFRRIVAYTQSKPITSVSTPKKYMQDISLASSKSTTSRSNDTSSKQDPPSVVDTAFTNMIFNAAWSFGNAGVGAVVVGGIVYKTLGLKVICCGFTVYGGLYLLEKYRWNTSGKEDNFKKQLKQHISIKLKDSANYHMTSCENETAKELETSFDHFKHAANEINHEMKSEIDELQKENQTYEKIIREIQSIKGKTSLVIGSVTNFASKYLSD